MAESNTDLTGLILYGDQTQNDMAGLPAVAYATKRHCLAHFHSSARWYTGVAVANPSLVETALVTITAYDSHGTRLDSVERGIPPKGKISELMSSLFGGVLGTGWLEIESDVDVLASLMYGDQISGGVASLLSSQLGNRVILPHFVQSNRWWTGISVLNAGTTEVSVTLKGYGEDGVQFEQRSYSMLPKTKVFGQVQDILPMAVNRAGWILVEASEASVGGLLVYGDRVVTPNRIAAMPAVPTSNDMYFSDFRSDDAWWTGIAFVNPNVASANILLMAYAPNGVSIDTVSQTVPAFGKKVGFVGNLFQLGTQTEGWVKAISDVPIVGLEVLNANDDAEEIWGLAGIESQPAGPSIYLGHYAVTAKWWTLFALANPNDAVTATGNLKAFGNDGTLAGIVTKTIPPNGRIADYVNSLFGIP